MAVVTVPGVITLAVRVGKTRRSVNANAFAKRGDDVDLRYSWRPPTEAACNS